MQNPPTCPPGFQYNTNISKCEQILCPEGTSFNTTSNKCISICKANFFYNATSKVCEVSTINCASGQMLNATTGNCQQIVCSNETIFDPISQKCIDKYSNSMSLCPPQKPFWNSTSIKCEVCPGSSPVYNSEFHRCDPCPKGLSWNPTDLVCQPTCNVDEQLDKASLTCKKVCDMNMGQFFNQTTKQCQDLCSIEKG